LDKHPPVDTRLHIPPAKVLQIGKSVRLVVSMLGTCMDYWNAPAATATSCDHITATPKFSCIGRVPTCFADRMVQAATDSNSDTRQSRILSSEHNILLLLLSHVSATKNTWKSGRKRDGCCRAVKAERYTMSRMTIAIDGPAGSGKSTVACLLAARIGAVHIDTGAMYRAVTMHWVQCG
jgi:hypothetical protein